MMGFTAKQVQALRRDVDNRAVRTRTSNGRELSYIEGWYVISEANRIFGFDGWNRETIETKCVLARESRGTFQAIYTNRVRISVRAGGAIVVREGHGTGQGSGASAGEVHDTAIKAAETDATKRAFATFGKPFGLALYGRALTSPSVPDSNQSQNARGQVSLPPDDTTPIPRPSRYYGRRQDLITRDSAQGRRLLAARRSSDASLVPAQQEATPGKIDKSALAIGEPKRIREKAHLRFVASHPCLVCGRQPSDPHHLRFAQPRALGMKVSDEFTVPLCREHHRQLHQAGNEIAWWHNLNIKPLPIARALWEQNHPLAYGSAATGGEAIVDDQAQPPPAIV
jgi:Rad52/22 family double-strand break repair protein